MDAVKEKAEIQIQDAADADADFAGELGEPRWSVISFESVAVQNLTYDEAKIWLEKLRGQKIAGLCIITDEAAQRAAQK